MNVNEIKLYGEQDLAQGRESARREGVRTVLCALPFAVLAVAAFVLRIEPLCVAGVMVCGGLVILRFDLRVSPQLRYNKYLREVRSGLTRRTAGALVRVSTDLVYEEGVYFREVILNIYEDMAEEGERRFLLDSAGSIPEEWIGRDVAVVSHGNYILEMRVMEGDDGRD